MTVVVAVVMLSLGLDDDEADFSDSDIIQLKNGKQNKQHIRSLISAKTHHKAQKTPKGA